MYILKDCKRKRQRLSMSRIARSKLTQTISSICDVITKRRSVHVRGPGETGGAFGFALIFLLLFASRQKVDKDF